jgi:hypothetical protein
MISGTSNAAYAYCYYKAFDDNIAIQAGTKLRSLIHRGRPISKCSPASRRPAKRAEAAVAA